jgi:UDP-N-acetylmuramoylalanine--D-glutamate ligase
MRFPGQIFAGQRFAVVGLGRNGLPAASVLQAMGATVTAWDDNEQARLRAMASGLDVARPSMKELAGLVLSPGIPHRLPRPHAIAAQAISAGVPILTDAELLWRAVRCAGSKAKFVGITGTNGKSTTTALLAHILEGAEVPVAAGGNLGAAALALPLLDDDGVYVIEMSSYMLERIATLRFDVAAMLNLSADHLDRHGDMAGYAAAKRAIFDRQTGTDVAVIGVDDPDAREMARWLRTRPARVVEISAATVPAPLDQALARAHALPGAHNAQNTAAAAAIAAALGLTQSKIAHGIETYPGLPHRQELVATAGGIRFINDSKATNAESSARALACYDRLIWIAGGTAKVGGIESLAVHFPRIALALLVGRDAGVLAKTLAAQRVTHRDVGTLDNAVAEAWRAARAGMADVVLLSPACASWDQFTGFDQRGDQFRALVQQLRETV